MSSIDNKYCYKLFYMIWLWKGKKWDNNYPLLRTHELRYRKMKLASKMFSIVYCISVALVPDHFFPYWVSYIFYWKLHSRLVIKVPVLILWVFRMTNRAHTCCCNLEYSALALLMIGNLSTILYYYLHVWKICDATRLLTGTCNSLLPVLFDDGLVVLEWIFLLTIFSEKPQKNT